MIAPVSEAAIGAFRWMRCTVSFAIDRRHFQPTNATGDPWPGDGPAVAGVLPLMTY
jgi:hypothetical protein